MSGCSEDARGEQALVQTARAETRSAEPSGSAEPAPGRPLPIELELPAKRPGERRVSVYLDAGHGAADNPGNTSCFCVREQDFTHALADDVQALLEDSGRFWVVRSRAGDQLVAYSSRVDEALRLKADVFVSLHSDVRGKKELWNPEPSLECQRASDAPGYSVLYSDEGPPGLVEKRLRLAERVAAAMGDAAFIPYGGAEYVGLYEGVGEGTGVFVDRHEPQKRIFVLRRPAMPSIIVETHNALDPEEAAAWETTEVRRAFAFALAKGILEATVAQR